MASVSATINPQKGHSCSPTLHRESERITTPPPPHEPKAEYAPPGSLFSFFLLPHHFLLSHLQSSEQLNVLLIQSQFGSREEKWVLLWRVDLMATNFEFCWPRKQREWPKMLEKRSSRALLASYLANLALNETLSTISRQICPFSWLPGDNWGQFWPLRGSHWPIQPFTRLLSQLWSELSSVQGYKDKICTFQVFSCHFNASFALLNASEHIVRWFTPFGRLSAPIRGKFCILLGSQNRFCTFSANLTWF